MLEAAKKFFTGEEIDQKPELTLLESPTLTMTVRTPDTLEDIPKCTKILVEGEALLLDLSNFDLEEHQHILDYMAGVCFVLEADVKKISETVLLYTPQGVEIQKQ